MSMFDFTALPTVSKKRIAIHIEPHAEKTIREGHPWLFDGSIRKQSHDGQAGDLAVIFDQNRDFLAIGLYDPDSPIRVKILHHGQPATINADWFAEKIQTAIQRRAVLHDDGTTGYRVIHGENDSLPSLILDRYDLTYVLKLYSTAWLPHLADIFSILKDQLNIESLVLRLARNIQSIFDEYGLHDGQVLLGSDIEHSIIFQENGLVFKADVIHGHKTGHFFDQRDNRQQVRQLSAGKSVLDVFSYNGAFSVYAASGGATSVTSLDISEPALNAAQENMALNNHLESVANCNHQILVADAFEGLSDLIEQGASFDMVIVDPPSFAKRANEVDGALHAYERLASLAMQLVPSGGDFIMASCSSRVHPDQFVDAVQRGVKKSGRKININQQTSHALDHPIQFPEGEYLKCIFATVK